MFLNQSFELKASNLVGTCVRIKETDFSKFEEDFAGAYQQAPKLFKKASFIVEFTYDDFVASNKLKRIRKCIEGVGATLLGIRSDDEAQREEIKKAGLNVIHDNKSQVAPQLKKPPKLLESKGLMVQGKVRSGTQIYAKDKDLVVCGDVSHGSEIIASGNIFIYGALYGKAIAGSDGDTKAQIFCSEFSPELVSIAGVYIVNEDIGKEYQGNSVSGKMIEDRIVLEIFSGNKTVKNY